MWFFKQKTAYEMRISDWSSDVCSSDLDVLAWQPLPPFARAQRVGRRRLHPAAERSHRGLSARHLQLPVEDRKSVVSGKSVSVRVDLGGRRIIKKTNYSVHNPYRHSSIYTSSHRIILYNTPRF